MRRDRSHHLHPAKSRPKVPETNPDLHKLRGLVIDWNNPELHPDTREAAKYRINQMVVSGMVEQSLVDSIVYGEKRIRYREIRDRICADNYQLPEDTSPKGIDDYEIWHLPTTPELTAGNDTDLDAAFERDIELLNNPACGTPEWRESVMKLFTDADPVEFRPTQKSRWQKIRSSKIGKHEITKQSEPKRAFTEIIKSKAKNIFSSLMANEVELVLPHQPRHLRTDKIREYKRPRFEKVSKKVAAIGFTVIALAGAYIATGSSNEKDAAPHQAGQPKITNLDSTIQSSNPTPRATINKITVTKAEPAVAINAPELDPTSKITITISKRGSLWKDTESVLRETNPAVSDQEINNVVHKITEKYGLKNPNLVYKDNTFTIQRS